MNIATNNNTEIKAPLSPGLVVHYRHGFCTHLALSLHRLTGRPLAILIRDFGGGGIGLVHAGVEIDGYIFDAIGFSSEAETIDYYTAEPEHGEPETWSWKWYYFDQEKEFKKLLARCNVIIDEDGYQIHKSINVAKTLVEAYLND